ncbi:MAG: hypothetical protein VW599_12250, partial [Pseudomonadales bacterium]
DAFVQRPESLLSASAKYTSQWNRSSRSPSATVQGGLDGCLVSGMRFKTQSLTDWTDLERDVARVSGVEPRVARD